MRAESTSPALSQSHTGLTEGRQAASWLEEGKNLLRGCYRVTSELGLDGEKDFTGGNGQG